MKKYVNIPKNLCNHMIGENHKYGHRIMVGTLIMIVGVGITQICFVVESSVIHFAGETVGYLIHGIGAVPYVEFISKIGKNGKESDNRQPGSETKRIFDTPRSMFSHSSNGNANSEQSN